MKKKLFKELCESIKEAGKILEKKGLKEKLKKQISSKSNKIKK